MANVPGGPEPSIWRTLDGRPIPRRTQAGTGTLAPPSLTKPAGSGAQFHQPAPQQQAPVPRPLGVPPAPRMVLATWWSRAGAFLIDGLVFGSATLVVTLSICVAGGMRVEDALLFLSMQEGPPKSLGDPALFYVALTLQILGPAVMASVMLTRWNGQTVGKQALRIRVVRADGGPMTLRTAVRREVFARALVLSLLSVATFGLAFVLNYLWPLWDQQSRTGQDFVAGTRVVQVPRER